ncbi:MAG: general secretion pathway protein GspF [Microcoleus sp. SIO2G3]|nr:general secretion pathway protein GspF [Microcoleus sp. SIO2G3]
MHRNQPHASYLQSRLWLDRHSDWLRRAHYRCSMFPWVTVGRKARGKYCRYHIHHTHYSGNYQRNERLWLDVLPLCPFAHRVIHRGLGGSDRARAQRHRFPNLVQRLAHAWCRLPIAGKIIVLGAVLVGVLRMAQWLAR